jgi:hypothetical protein
MTVEVRQLSIRAQLGAPGASAQGAPASEPQAPAGLSEAQFEQLRTQLIAECRAWLALQQRLRDER